MTVDVEDYFHVTALSGAIDRDDWSRCESRVEANTNRILALLDDKSVKGTFFVLGWEAERRPGLVRCIAEAGHEIACHGYSHELVYRQSPETFREETRRAKALLEDCAQTDVLGYRAASYSITPKSRWALDILCEEGFHYDSSIFPIRHDIYGMELDELGPHRLTTDNGNSIVEFPISVVNLMGANMPASGGGYFRLYPYALSKYALTRVNRERPFVFYLHPWEVDPDQPRFDVSWKSRFRHYNNLGKCHGRLSRLLDDFSFTTIRDVIHAMDLFKG